MSQMSGDTRVSSEVLAMLCKVSTGTLSGLLNRKGYRQLFMQDVVPLRPDLRLAGQAVTLRYIPAREDLEQIGEFDNLTNKQRVAVELVGPGNVLVIDARGDTGAGSLGNILVTRIKQRGAAGIVTDGAFRDTPGVRAVDLPTYSKGQHANISFTRHHPVDINVPIACGGVAVLPGDVIVGDGEGVIVIPRSLTEEIAVAAREQERKEAFILSKIERGSSIIGVYPPSEETLREYEAWKRDHGGG
jgi:regulator of RNase E activity RraA